MSGKVRNFQVAQDTWLCVIIKVSKTVVMNRHQVAVCCTPLPTIVFNETEKPAPFFFIPDVIWAAREANNRREPEDRSIAGKH